MAYAYVGGNETVNWTGASVGSISTTYTPTAGNTLIILVTNGNTSTVTPSGGGNTYVSSGVGPLGATANSLLQAYYVSSCNGGSTTFVATFGTSTPYVGIRVEEFSGLGAFIGAVGQNQTSPGTGAGAVTSGNLNVTPVPAMFYGWGTNYSGSATLSATAMWTENRNVFAAANGAGWSLSADVLDSSAGNLAATFTTSSAGLQYGTFALAFALGASSSAVVAWLT